MSVDASNVRDLLERRGHSGRDGDPKASKKEEVADDYIAFAHGRIGTRAQLAVVFRKSDGASRAFAYSHLYCVAGSSPSEGFVIEFSHHKASVTGRNLESLYEYFCRQRVADVVEASRHQILLALADEPVIESIVFEPA